MNIRVYESVFDDEYLPKLVEESVYQYDCADTGEQMNSPANIVKMINTIMKLGIRTEEYVDVLALDAAYHVIGVFETSHGGVDYAICNPREIFMRLLLSGAKNFVILHNHPSGNILPSIRDDAVFEQMKESGILLGIRLADFIIIGHDGNFYSYQEQENERCNY